MKKHTRILALVLALSMMLLTGCSFNKSYNSLEEWYDANPMMSSLIDMGIAAEEDGGNEMALEIQGNTVVYILKMEEQMFGVNAETDAYLQQFFDQSFDAESTTYTDIITDMADASGLPASSISVRIEIYNPGASTPGYTKTFTQN